MRQIPGRIFFVVKFSEVRRGWLIGEIGMRILECTS